MQSLLSGVKCSGSEERLADCDHDGVGLGDTVGCERAYIRCLHKIMVKTGKRYCFKVSICTLLYYVCIASVATTENATAVIIGSSVGGVFLLLVVVTVIVIL